MLNDKRHQSSNFYIYINKHIAKKFCLFTMQYKMAPNIPQNNSCKTINAYNVAFFRLAIFTLKSNAPFHTTSILANVHLMSLQNNRVCAVNMVGIIRSNNPFFHFHVLSILVKIVCIVFCIQIFITRRVVFYPTIICCS